MKSQSSTPSIQTSTLLADFRLLLILFVTLRVMLLMIYQPIFGQGIERGVTAGGDFFTYFQLGSLAGQGLLPFRNWWSEFPPIPSFLESLVFVLFGKNGYTGFALVFGVIMMLFDLGNLMLVRRIGTRLYGAGTGMALAWVYALTLAPLVLIWWDFEPMVAFFLLWGLATLIEYDNTRSALIAAVGALVKFTPALILGAIWRFRPTRFALRYSLIVVGIFAAVYVVLFAQNAPMTLPSLTAQFSKASYETVWALIDGNYTTGNFGPAQDRLDPANASKLEGKPSVIPGIVRLLAAAAVGAFVFWRTRRFDERGLVAFVTITLLIFFIQAQGWSPQWLAQIAPLMLLCFPTRDGVTSVVLLSLVTFAEYPFLFIRTGDTGGTISGALMTPFVVLVLARTAILIGMGVALYRRLRQEPLTSADQAQVSFPSPTQAGRGGKDSQFRMIKRRGWAAFVLIALVGAFAITRGLIAAPGYTDVYYHFNAAARLASGQGLTDPYVWTYIGALDHLPMPSHLYWMPLTSVIAGLSMSLFHAPNDYVVAQIPFTLMFAATACVGFWLGGQVGGKARHAWVAGLLTLFSGFYTKFWGEIDTFAPYALVGSLCLVVMGVGAGLSRRGFKPSANASVGKPTKGAFPDRKAASAQWIIVWFAAGGLAGLGHLTRADGLLLLIVGVAVILWMGWREMAHSRAPLQRMMICLAALMVGYLLVMLPFFIRNMQAIGSPLPLGGTQAIWFSEYNDIFNFPPNASPATLLANGLATLISSRREALVNNLATFVAVEGLVVMTPLMLIGWWRRRHDSFLLPFGLYAIGLHLAMTLVFPFPGYRGGLLHSAAALIPFWAALGVAGLDDAVDWIARWRRRWNVRTAKAVFSGGLVAVAVGLSLYIGVYGQVGARTPILYLDLKQTLPADARVLSDDPPELYYYTGMSGATLPNGSPETLLDVARRYDIGYLLLKNDPGSIPAGLLPILDDPPAFLKPLPFESARLYAIDRSP